MSMERAISVQRVLMPTDFSSNAETAVQWAIEVARAHGASVTFMHVDSTDDLPLPVQERIMNGLSQLKERAGAVGVVSACMRRSGCPWRMIAAEATAHDLVVIGARGQTPRAVRVLGLGSTADRVLRASTAPVLTVHTADTPNSSPRTLLVPTDFSRSAMRAAHGALAVFPPAAGAPRSITLLHAWQPLIEYDVAFIGGAIINPLDETEDQARSLLATAASELRDPHVDVEPVLRPGYPAKTIVDEAHALSADLIAVGTHGRSGVERWMLGSVAERVVHDAPCPVLTVRLPVDAAERNDANRVEYAS